VSSVLWPSASATVPFTGCRRSGPRPERQRCRSSSRPLLRLSKLVSTGVMYGSVCARMPGSSVCHLFVAIPFPLHSILQHSIPLHSILQHSILRHSSLSSPIPSSPRPPQSHLRSTPPPPPPSLSPRTLDTVGWVWCNRTQRLGTLDIVGRPKRDGSPSQRTLDTVGWVRVATVQQRGRVPCYRVI
jgi:hypothetical protein